jgi:hypothetical protein
MIPIIKYPHFIVQVKYPGFGWGAVECGDIVRWPSLKSARAWMSRCMLDDWSREYRIKMYVRYTEW